MAYMLYQIYVISKIKLNLETFRYNVGSQHCQNNRKYPTFLQFPGLYTYVHVGFVFSLSANVSNLVIGFGLITLLINFFGRIADWNCYIDTRETDGITDW